MTDKGKDQPSQREGQGSGGGGVSKLLLGDCLEVMRTMPDASVDAVVTDPPYGLSFMGKKWDYDVPSVEIWAECLRVLKPGGHLLAFAGTRTQHRMAVRIEDAGFEIRDMIAWVYGSGFPKSMDVSKAIDKRGGNAHLTAEIGAALKAARKARGIGVTEADRTYCGGVTLWSWYEGRPAGQQMPTAEVMSKIANDWPELQRYADAIEEAEREVVGQRLGSLLAVAPGQGSDRNAATLHLTALATPEAQQWAGWGTALKPALEPITMARKPLEGTVAANVLAHGTGGINVDGCRVGETVETWPASRSYAPGQKQPGGTGVTQGTSAAPAGRWPANLIHDGSDEVVGLFPAEARSSCGGGKSANAKSGYSGGFRPDHDSTAGQYYDTGSAARFFYTAKCSKKDRSDGNTHPTVKPTDLMRYLCRLVTPPGGVVLDPFMGSGSTGKAAMLEGFEFIGIEREAAYHAIAESRIGRAAAAGYQPSLLP
jgi:DNA modification methylase